MPFRPSPFYPVLSNIAKLGSKIGSHNSNHLGESYAAPLPAASKGRLECFQERQPLAEPANHSHRPEGAHEPAPEPVQDHNAPVSRPRPNGSEHEEKPSAPFNTSMLNWTRVVGVFTAVLAIVGGIQAWAFIQSERSFLYFQVDGISPFPIPADKPLSVGIGVINTGRAQAILVGEKILIPQASDAG